MHPHAARSPQDAVRPAGARATIAVNRSRGGGTDGAMAALLPRSSSLLLLGLSLVIACDRAEATTAKASPSEPAARADAKLDTEREAPQDATTKTETPAAAEAGEPVPAVAAPVPAPAGTPVALGSAAAMAEGAVVDGLSIVTHTVIAPKRTGDSKEDYWTQYQVWGELTNHSSEVMESISGTITFHDAAGAMIGIDSIGTAIKQDFGDTSPGETILAAVSFVQPGQTVPFHFTRNLDAIKGDIASHRVTPRRATRATGPTPKGVAVDVKERFEGEGFHRKRIFEGTIRNDGEGGCRSPEFVAAFLDAAGKVAHVARFDASDDLQQMLAKGESMPFSGGVYVTGDDAWRETAAVKTYVSCRPIY
jgi:hypothetical protein